MNFNIEFLKNKIAEVESEIIDIQKKEIEVAQEVIITDEAKRLLEMLKTAKVKAKKDFILNIINTALLDIFQQDIRLEIKSSDEDQVIQEKQKKLNIKYDMILLENGIEIGRNEKLLTSNGGGVLSIISLLLKILTGYIYSSNKFYLFDESLAQVSIVYQERLSLFLSEFCDRYGFTIIMVNHNPNLASHADMSYTFAAQQLDDKLKKLKVDKLEIKENFDTDNSYELEIKNFQSIIDMKLSFKGFVSITGPNNIGKSAITRAINSIIFNSFHESYLRKNETISSIKMSFDDKWVLMVYKNKKIVYSFWDGTELTGKKLAQDKIQEKMEQIGFRYLNISKKYSNWKSDLKDQVDRLYVATQHDKMYLIGSKSNDSDKIFNFLFDAETIAQALMNAGYDLRNLLIEQKSLFESKQSLTDELEILKKRLKIEQYYFLKNLIAQATEKADKIKQLEESKTVNEKILSSITKMVSACDVLNKYQEVNENLKKYKDFYKKLLDNNIKIHNILEKLSQYDVLSKTVKRYGELKSSVNQYASTLETMKNKLAIIKDIINKLVNLDSLKNIVTQCSSTIENIRKYEDAKVKLDAWWKEFTDKLDIQPCTCCNGKGFVIK